MKSKRSRRSRSRKSRKVILPHPTKGAMGNYSTSLPADKRHNILRRLVTKLGYSTVVHDLSLRATLNKHNATVHGKMKKDMEWLHGQYR